MAVSCRNFGCPHPFFKKNAIFENPPESPETADGSTESLVLNSKEIGKELNEENRRILDELAGKMVASGVENYAEALQEIKNLAERLEEIERKIENFEVDEKVGKESRELLLNVFAKDFQLSQDDLEATERSLLHAEEVLQLRKSLSRPFAPIFLRRTNGPKNYTRVQQKEANSEFQLKNTYQIDFGAGDLNDAQVKAAERDFALHEMLTDRGVHLVKLTRGGKSPLELVRCEDGKFREVGKENEVKHYFVYDGDRIEIVQQSEGIPVEELPLPAARASTPEEPSPAFPDAHVAHREVSADEIEAGERFSTYESAKARQRKDYIDRAQLELTWGVEKKIPSALQNWSDQVYSRKFKDLDLGEQILGDLKVMADIAGQPTETMMWGEIRDKRLKPDVISYQELTRSVFGRSPDGLRQRYETIKTSLEEDDLNETKKAKLLAEQKKIEDFFAAAMSFMNTIDKLGVRKEETADSAPEKPKNFEKVERVLDLLFGAEKSKGPLTRPGIFARLFQKAEKTPINMQLFGGKVEYQSRMEEYLSEESAYTYLLHQALSNSKTGEVEITDESLAKFAKYLTELRDKGVVDALADKDLAEKVKLEKNSYEVITAENMEEVLADDTQKELVRRGCAVDLSEDYTKGKLEEQEFLKEAGSPMEQAQLQQILDLSGPLTNDQLRQVTENLHSLYIGTAGFIFNDVEGEHFQAGFGADLNIPSAVLLDDGKTKILVRPHIGAKENVISMDTEIHAGAGIQIKHGRFDLRFQAGGQVGLEKGISLGAGTQAGVALDQYSAWTIHVGAGAGLTPASMASAFVFSVGIDREMSGVLAKKTEKMRKGQEVNLKEGMSSYNRLLVAQGYSAEEVKAMEAQMNAMLVQQLGNQVIEKLNAVQFLGAGLAVVPFPSSPLGFIPIPYVKVGFKGKTFMTYNKPKDAPNLDNVAEARLQKEIAKQSGTVGEPLVDWIEVYESGATLYSTGGNKTITAGVRKVNEIPEQNYIQGKQDVLAQQGIQLEKTPIGIRLRISKVDGAVDVYTDPKVNMETGVGSDGYIYLIMHDSDTLSVRRVDQSYPFEHFGNTHRVQIFLSNNVHVANEVIQGESKEHIHYTEAFGKRTKAEVVQDQLEGNTASFDASSGGKDFSPETLLYGNELADRQEIHANMSKLLEQGSMGEKLEIEERTKLYQAAQSLLDKDKKNSPPFLTYQKLASTHSFEDVKKFILENHPKDSSGKDWTNHSLSYMHQSLMMASLKENRDKKPEEMAKLILDWNTKRLNEVLVGRGMEKTQAARIAKNLVAYFSRSIKEKLENPDAQGLSYINLQEGSIVQIEVAGKTGGYRESFWSADPNIDRIFAAINMEEVQLTSIFSLEVGTDQGAKDAKAFLATMTERLSPLPADRPKEFMRSQLGLAVLDSADIIFSVEEGKKLVELFALTSTNTTNGLFSKREQLREEYKDIYDKYSKIVLALREPGEWENERVKLSSKRSQDVGFFDKCMNLTFVMNESLTIQVKVTQEKLKTAQSAGVTVRDFLPGRKGVQFIGTGVAAAYVETPKKPPEETPPEDDAEKGPLGIQGTGPRPVDGFGAGAGTDEDAGDAGADW